jgi:hypothetical protein
MKTPVSVTVSVSVTIEKKLLGSDSNDISLTFTFHFITIYPFKRSLYAKFINKFILVTSIKFHGME